MKKETMSAAEKKRIEVLDRKIEKLQLKVSRKSDEYEALNAELMELIYERYPERKNEFIKKALYDAYCKSGKSLEEVLALIQGPDQDEDDEW